MCGVHLLVLSMGHSRQKFNTDNDSHWVIVDPVQLQLQHLQECFSKSSLMASSDNNLSPPPSTLNKVGHSPWSGLSSWVKLVEHSYSMGHWVCSSIVKHSCPCSHSSISLGSGLGRLEKESSRGRGCKGGSTVLNIALQFFFFHNVMLLGNREDIWIAPPYRKHLCWPARQCYCVFVASIGMASTGVNDVLSGNSELPDVDVQLEDDRASKRWASRCLIMHTI